MTERQNKFLWNIHTALSGGKKPGSEEDRQFLALALFGEVGELANFLKKEWRGDDVPDLREKVTDELGDCYAYLRLLAIALNQQDALDRSSGIEPTTKRRCALRLCGRVGELAGLIEEDPASGSNVTWLLMTEIRDLLTMLARAHVLELDDIMERVTLPKIRARWGDKIS
ncbi:MAG: MazG-like family protein [Elusimicrobia bacterium]|nr:MazG-like family protein [Elusimicrobiota bacterium]